MRSCSWLWKITTTTWNPRFLSCQSKYFHLDFSMPHFFVNRSHVFSVNIFTHFVEQHGYPNDYLVKKLDNFEMKVPVGNVGSSLKFLLTFRMIFFQRRISPTLFSVHSIQRSIVKLACCPHHQWIVSHHRLLIPICLIFRQPNEIFNQWNSSV